MERTWYLKGGCGGVLMCAGECWCGLLEILRNNYSQDLLQGS